MKKIDAPESAQNGVRALMNTREAARFLGISLAYLHRLTMRREIPHYKPTGRRCFFDGEELTAWQRRNRIATADELQDEANRRLMKGRAV